MSEDDSNAYYFRGKRLGKRSQPDPKPPNESRTEGQSGKPNGHSGWENGPIIHMPCGAPVYLGYKISTDGSQKQKKKLDLSSYHAHLEACFNQKGLCFYPVKK